MSRIVQSYSQRANQLDILLARRYKYIKYHNLSLRRSIHRDTFRVCKHLENYSRDHVSTWTIPRTSRREMLRREVERLYRSFEQGTFERGGGGLISVECTIVRKTHVENDGGSAQKFITAWRKTRRAKGAATPFSRERSARFSLTSPSPVSR